MGGEEVVGRSISFSRREIGGPERECKGRPTDAFEKIGGDRSPAKRVCVVVGDNVQVVD